MGVAIGGEAGWTIYNFELLALLSTTRPLPRAHPRPQPLPPSLAAAAAASLLSRAMPQVSLPPLPFLPVPHLGLHCPSKAICEEDPKAGGEQQQGAAEEGEEGGEGEGEQERPVGEEGAGR